MVASHGVDEKPLITKYKITKLYCESTTHFGVVDFRHNTTHYINSTNPELIFVKMQDQETKEFEITTIILLAEACL